MGFLSNLFSKQTCELCGKEVGALSRSKLNDGKYICYDCTKNCSAFFPVVRYSLEEVKQHIEYMKKMDSFCKEVFDKDTNKKDFALMFQKTGIRLSDSLGMFEIITSKTKQKNYRELFRYDQIWDFKLYGKENTGENVTKKYNETGIKIKMISKLDNDPLINVSNNYDVFKHPYAQEFEVLCNHSTDTLDGGLLLKHLDMIINNITSESNATTRTGYRDLREVDMYFNRAHWKEVADKAETNFFGSVLDKGV